MVSLLEFNSLAGVGVKLIKALILVILSADYASFFYSIFVSKSLSNGGKIMLFSFSLSGESLTIFALTTSIFRVLFGTNLASLKSTSFS